IAAWGRGLDAQRRDKWPILFNGNGGLATTAKVSHVNAGEKEILIDCALLAVDEILLVAAVEDFDNVASRRIDMDAEMLVGEYIALDCRGMIGMMRRLRCDDVTSRAQRWNIVDED